MKESEVRKERKVIISSINHTKTTHTICNTMKHMTNNIYKIEDVEITRFGITAIINGYYWHAKDLTLYKEVPLETPKTYNFDPKELVI